MRAVLLLCSSPRTRRYFRRYPRRADADSLFSAHAEVFPIGARSTTRSATLLRARGGISIIDNEYISGYISSPRTRRYFRHKTSRQSIHALFSAHAEVFPTHLRLRPTTSALLRARGGISIGDVTGSSRPPSSPRTRRYFRRVITRSRNVRLFSAHAEVFPGGFQRH